MGFVIPPPTWSSGRRYSVFQQKFLSFFSFAKGSLRWLYRQGNLRSSEGRIWAEFGPKTSSHVDFLLQLSVSAYKSRSLLD